MEELDVILKNTFTNTFRKDYYRVDGVLMPIRYRDFYREILDMEVYDTDIWICSYPKSGTTWTQEMVWMIMNDLDFLGGQKNLGYRSPFLEVSALFDYRDLMLNNPEFKPPIFLENSIKFVEEQKNLRIIKTHLPWILLPKQIQNMEKMPKIVYVARNVKDTCISYYHHCQLLEGYTGNFAQFCQLFLNGKLTYSPYWKHVLDFWHRKNQPNIMFLKYEDMKRDLPQIIRGVSHFLGKSMNENDVKILEKHLSFESMKQNQSVNYEMIVELNKKFNLINYDGKFMRSGQIGQHKTIMSGDMIKQFDQWIQSNCQDFI